MKLRRRRKRFPGDRHPLDHTKHPTGLRALRGFHAPQRDHVKQPMPPYGQARP